LGEGGFENESGERALACAISFCSGGAKECADRESSQHKMVTMDWLDDMTMWRAWLSHVVTFLARLEVAVLSHPAHVILKIKCIESVKVFD
jgi:hypothetical protein